MSKRVPAYACLLVLVAVPGFSANLDLTPLHRQLQFNFGNPGARSLGMGGAFLGRADDASAAEANPAGLTIIARPEATVEVGQTKFTSSVPTAGTVGGTAKYLDVESDVSPSLRFLSVAFPVKSFVLSGYYHKPFDFEQSIGVRSGQIRSGNIIYLDGASEIDYHMDTFGLAGAWKTGGLSLGAALRYHRFKPESSGELLDSDTGDLLGRIGTSGTDSDITYSVGFKWATASEAFGIGGVYKKGGDFAFQEFDPNQTYPSSLTAPDIAGLGVSFRPKEGLTFNIDVNKIGYSSLLDDFQPVLSCSTTEFDASCYDISDATEVRFGVEWTMPNASVPLALRAGFWRDPAHVVERSGTTACFVFDSQSFCGADVANIASFLFPRGDDQNHITVGIGYLGGSFEVNAAYDHADANSQAAVSVLKRF